MPKSVRSSRQVEPVGLPILILLATDTRPQSAQQKLKCVEVELSAKIEALEKTIKDSERKSNHWRKEAGQLRKIERQEEIDYDVRVT